MFSNHFIPNFPQNARMKKFWQSVNIWQRYRQNSVACFFGPPCIVLYLIRTRKPSYRWQTRATRKPAKNCSNSTCLQRCRCRYWPIFMRLAVVASEIPRNSLKIQAYGVQGHRYWCQWKVHMWLAISH